MHSLYVHAHIDVVSILICDRLNMYLTRIAKYLKSLVFLIDIIDRNIMRNRIK